MIYLKMDLLDVLLRYEFANHIEPFRPNVLILSLMKTLKSITFSEYLRGIKKEHWEKIG